MRRGFKEIPDTFDETLEKDHGRIEERHCWATADVEWLAHSQRRRRPDDESDNSRQG